MGYAVLKNWKETAEKKKLQCMLRNQETVEKDDQ